MWREVQPELEAVAEEATDALEILGITYDLQKTGTVQRLIDNSEPNIAGHAWGTKKFRIYTDASWAVELTPKTEFDLTSTVVHEVIHNARAERYTYKGDLEMIASEGLAYVGEYLFSRQRGKRYSRPALTRRELAYDQRIEQKFIKMASASKRSPEYRQWAGEYAKGKPHSERDLFAIQRVYSQVRSKYALEDLIEMPARRVLDL